MHEVTKKLETADGIYEVRLRATTPHEYEVTVMDDDYAAAPFVMQKRGGRWKIADDSAVAFWLVEIERDLLDLIGENRAV